MGNNRMGLVLFSLAGLGAGVFVGATTVGLVWQGDPAARPNPAERSLDATLWMQTSAEYEACCLQAYRIGKERLEAKLAAPAPPTAKPPAVVMDLDETVFDNSPFQAYLILHGLKYSDDLWAVWEKDHADDVRLVPGAKGFIDFAAEQKVPVVYISNRLTKYASSTEEAIKHLGLNSENIGERLLLKTDTSDKSARRKQVEEKYRVLLFFGDNLRDFSEEFITPTTGDAIAERKQMVGKEAAHFGDDWIILPNPVYGEWTKPLGDHPKAKLDAMKLNSVGR
jgi:acid phosphatase